MEHKVRMTPTYDLITSSEAYVAPGIKDGVFQRVEWKPFFTEDTNPKMAIEHPLVRGSVVNYTGYLGLMVNPEKVPAGEFPKAWADLANPKWQGKVGILNVASTYARWAYVLGKEKMVADLRAVVKNKPIIGRYADQLNRYLLGEIWMGFVTSSYTQAAKEKGMPVVFQGLDFVEEARYLLALRTGAAHPNAAKLVAVYLSTPAGAKFMLEEAAKGNSLYPGNFEHDLRKQLEAQGATIYARTAYPGLLEFLLSKEIAKWTKEMNLILKGRR
jgi:ABC-type Fe3+ transport system substrate-binding protein